MINVKDLLIETVNDYMETKGYEWPVIQQGSMEAGWTYPEHFFTFFNNDSFDLAFYDNDENRTVWDFDLNVYSIDPELANTVLREVKPMLKAQGFICAGAGYDVMSDHASHIGRGMNVKYLENL